MKQILPDGSVQLSTPQCTFVFKRMPAAAMLITINGTDAGQFGAATLDEIRAEIARNKPLELFIDASNAISASVEVSREWTHFFSIHQHNLKRVHILVGSKFIELVVSIAQHLSKTGKLIEVYANAYDFNELVSRRASDKGIGFERAKGI